MTQRKTEEPATQEEKSRKMQVFGPPGCAGLVSKIWRQERENGRLISREKAVCPRGLSSGVGWSWVACRQQQIPKKREHSPRGDACGRETPAQVRHCSGSALLKAPSQTWTRAPMPSFLWLSRKIKDCTAPRRRRESTHYNTSITRTGGVAPHGKILMMC